jgi:hypothetical protein
LTLPLFSKNNPKRELTLLGGNSSRPKAGPFFERVRDPP